MTYSSEEFDTAVKAAHQQGVEEGMKIVRAFVNGFIDDIPISFEELPDEA